jgi:hypothetical protein
MREFSPCWAAVNDGSNQEGNSVLVVAGVTICELPVPSDEEVGAPGIISAQDTVPVGVVRVPLVAPPNVGGVVAPVFTIVDMIKTSPCQ